MILRMSLELPSGASYVPMVRGLSAVLLERLEVLPEDIDDAALLLTEMCANVVRHAYQGEECPYYVNIDYHPEHLLITVIDRGEGFERKSVPTPNPESEGGWGLWLVENLASSVEFQQNPEGGTRVQAKMNLRRRSDSDGGTPPDGV
jgi:serine/threonine-protein kinase RsbW